MKFFYLILLFFIVCSAHTKEAAVTAQRPKLIELFSSEGCSSCPPAEESLSKLTNDPHLWKLFVPVNFHVDYWNRLGWTDPYSKKLFTERQHDYARFWNTDSVYTPAFTVDGKSVGSSLNLASVGSSESFKDVKLNALVTRNGDEINFSVNFENINLNTKYIAYFAVLANGLESKVTSGENEGKTLKQNFVVLDFQKKELDAKSIKLSLKFNSNLKFTKLGYAFWITEKQKMFPVAVTGNYL